MTMTIILVSLFCVIEFISQCWIVKVDKSIVNKRIINVDEQNIFIAEVKTSDVYIIIINDGFLVFFFFKSFWKTKNFRYNKWISCLGNYEC